MNFKLNSILTLLNRAYSVSSSWLNFHKEDNFLSRYFIDNCFPKFLFDKYLKSFLNNKLQPITPITTVPKLDFYASLPYINNDKFLTTLRNILNKHFFCLAPKLVLRNPRTIGSLFKFKDTIPLLMRSLVVYKYTCPRCNLGTYIGATKRMLKVRIDSHRGVSHRTGNTLGRKEFSNIREHAIKCKSNIKYDNFETIAQAPNESSLPILESLLIKQLVPSLNSSSSAAPLYVTSFSSSLSFSSEVTRFLWFLASGWFYSVFSSLIICILYMSFYSIFNFVLSESLFCNYLILMYIYVLLCSPDDEARLRNIGQ